MTATPEPPALIAWDGHDTIAFAGPGIAGARAIMVGETAAGTALLAAADTGETVLVRLPQGCRVATLFRRDRDGRVSETGIEFDDLLVTGVVDMTAPGLFHLGVDGIASGSPRITASSLQGLNATGEAIGLGLHMADAGGRSRLRIGPLATSSDSAGPIMISVSTEAGGVRLTVDKGAEKVLVAHFPAAAARATAALSLLDTSVRSDVEAAVDAFAAGTVAAGLRDATRASPAAAFRRGFTLWPGAASILIERAAEGDEIAVFADRGAVLAAAGAPGLTGSRALIALDVSTPGGSPPSIAIISRPYRPATATALAEIGGGRSLALAGAAAPVIAGRQMERAADLAEAIWQRQRARGPTTASPLALHAPQGEPSALSPLLAALDERLRLPPAIAEEMDAETTDARLAFAFLALENPALARRVALARARLSNERTLAPELGHAAEWLLRAEAPALIGRAANRLAGEPMAMGDRRERQQLLDDLSRATGGGWIDADRLVAGWRLASVASDGEMRIATLLTALAADPALLGKAQRDAQTIDMGDLARLRAELPGRAGTDAALAAELAQSLPSLSPRDLLMIDAHFAREAAERRAISIFGAALTALETAAGAEGVAAGHDRNGDAMLGMSRLAAVTEPALRALLRLPAAHASVRDLNGWLAVAAPEPPADARAAALLRRNLQIFAFFLLYREIAMDAAGETRVEGATESPARRALLDRLSAGLVETLPKLVAAGAARQGERPLGRSFIGRLPASTGIVAP